MTKYGWQPEEGDVFIDQISQTKSRPSTRREDFIAAFVCSCIVGLAYTAMQSTGGAYQDLLYRQNTQVCILGPLFLLEMIFFFTFAICAIAYLLMAIAKKI